MEDILLHDEETGAEANGPAVQISKYVKRPVLWTIYCIGRVCPLKQGLFPKETVPTDIGGFPTVGGSGPELSVIASVTDQAFENCDAALHKSVGMKIDGDGTLQNIFDQSAFIHIELPTEPVQIFIQSHMIRFCLRSYIFQRHFLVC